MAASDEMATQAAAIVFDDCADRCDGAEVWHGIRLIADGSSLHGRTMVAAANQTSARAEQLFEALQTEIETIAASIEEAAITGSAVLRSSERLKQLLEQSHRRNGRLFSSRPIRSFSPA